MSKADIVLYVSAGIFYGLVVLASYFWGRRSVYVEITKELRKKNK